MTRRDGFARAIAHFGSEQKLTEAIGFSCRAIWWAKTPGVTTPLMAARIEIVTEGKVRREWLRADVFAPEQLIKYSAVRNACGGAASQFLVSAATLGVVGIGGTAIVGYIQRWHRTPVCGGSSDQSVGRALRMAVAIDPPTTIPEDVLMSEVLEPNLESREERSLTEASPGRSRDSSSPRKQPAGSIR